MTAVVSKDREGHALRSGITTFTAEADLEASPQLGIPEKISGKLVRNLTLEQFVQFTFRQGVEVDFESRGYRFSKVEKDGTFELSIIHQP